MDLRELCQKAKEAGWMEEFYAGQLFHHVKTDVSEFETPTVKEFMTTYYQEILAKYVAKRLELESFIEVFASLDDEPDTTVQVLEVDIIEENILGTEIALCNSHAKLHLARGTIFAWTKKVKKCIDNILNLY